MKLVVLNDVNYKAPKKYCAHYMTLHTDLHIPACFSKRVYGYKMQHDSLNYIQIYHLKAVFLLYFNS